MHNEKLIKAKVRLITAAPFFASIVLRKPIVLDGSIQTACTDGQTIRISPAAIEKWTVPEIAGVLAHEAMHIANGHHLRQGERNGTSWNDAADYAINPLLLKEMELPSGVLINPSFDGMGAEEIYSMIHRDQDDGKGKDTQGNGQQSQQPGIGNVEPAPASAGSSAQQEQQWKQEIAQAYHEAQRAGNTPAWLDRLIDEILPAKVDWREQLAAYLQQVAAGRIDYSWSRPNCRYSHTGLYLPSLSIGHTGNIAVLVDTSGSIGQSQMDEFASEINGIVQEASLDVTVIYFDSQIAGTQYFQAGSEVELEARGGGGTNYRPAFEYIDSEQISVDAVVVLTDGYCNSFPDDWNSPVLWALTAKNKSFQAPFGETITMKP